MVTNISLGILIVYGISIGIIILLIISAVFLYKRFPKLSKILENISEWISNNLHIQLSPQRLSSKIAGNLNTEQFKLHT